MLMPKRVKHRKQFRGSMGYSHYASMYYKKKMA